MLGLTSVASALQAQSGRAGLHGWVAFEDVAYVDSQPPDTGTFYRTITDQHGFFDFEHASLGAFELRISASHFVPCAAGVYLPSDFIGNWAILLKADTAQDSGH